MTSKVGPDGIIDVNGLRGPVGSSITLSPHVYQEALGGALDSANLGGKHLGDNGYQTFPLDFYNYIMSNSALISSYPFLKTCYTAYAHGIPSVKIRVSTLTDSTYNTITSAGFYTGSHAGAAPTSNAKPEPGSSVKGPAAPTTTSLPKLTFSSSRASSLPKLETQLASSVSNQPKAPADSHKQIAPEPSASPGASQQPTQPSISVIVPEENPNPQTNKKAENPPQNRPGAPPNSELKPSSSVQISASGSAVELNQPLDSTPSPIAPVVTIGEQAYSANSASQYLIGTKTLIPAGPAITINSIPYSLAPEATALVSAGSTLPIYQPKDDLPAAEPPIITIGNQKISANPASEYVIGTQTLSPGGPTILVNGVSYSLAPSATALVSGSKTVPLPLVYKGPSIPTDASSIQIGTQVLAPGSPAVTVGGIRYSLATAADALVSGSSTIALSLGNNPPQILTIDGNIRTADSASNYVIGTQTLIPGAHAITINGVPYSLVLSETALVSGSSTIRLDHGPSNLLPAITIDGGAYTANSASQYFIASQTLVPGGHPIIINDVSYSLAPSATALISGSNTIPLTYEPDHPLPTITVAGETYTANSASQYLIGSQTLIPGGQPIVINGVSYSLAPAATALVSGSNTIPLSYGSHHFLPTITIDGETYTANSALQYLIASQTLPSIVFVQPTLPAITIDGTVYPQNTASEFIIGSQTLLPNGLSITINSTPYALSNLPSGEALIIGTTSTSFLSPPPTITQAPAIITIGSSKYTEDLGASDFVIDGHTLVTGSAVTVNGTVISLGPEGTDVVVGTSTEAVNLGSLIGDGFGGGPTPGPSGRLDGSTGWAMGRRRPGWRVFGGVLVGSWWGLGWG